MKLTKLERLLISNQLRILEALYPNEADTWAVHRKAIENGYARNYRFLVDHLSEEMSEEACEEVIDILDMFRMIGNKADAEDKKDTNCRFRGFDGNNESAPMGYARYCIRDCDLFNEQANRDLNSHAPTLAVYRRMLEEWKRSRDKYELSKDDIQRILAAAMRPGV